ncbi:Endonuclease/exonuclease/phosphatase [Xylaria venustula]|nr:Endonuclease/exonuclease/phosphatase [Xylaria venustula]
MEQPVRCVEWKPDSPHLQPIFGFDGSMQTWRKMETHQSRVADTMIKMALFSWNIDFKLPYGRSRMEAALAELQVRIAALSQDTAAVIFLQECVAQDLDTIGSTAWVRTGFLQTDLDPLYWAGQYGTTTLVDRRLSVVGVFRVHYALTNMGRDGLFVDVALGIPSRDIRFCNTHLESFANEPAFRPPQMAVLAKFMHQESIHGALSLFDRTLHSDNNLRDAYLELGGQEDSKEGYTWGQQSRAQQRFSCRRMDKVLYCGDVSV